LKKALLLSYTFGFLFFVSVNVFALSFSVDASNSDIFLSNVIEGDWDYGGSDILANLSTPYDNPYTLNDGESLSFEFATITLTGYGWIAIGSADVTATLAFYDGDSSYTSDGTANYITMLGGLIDAGGLHWTTQPGIITIDNGAFFDIQFEDIEGLSINQDTYSIMATVTGHAAPVPEPATMLLLGTGLIGIASVSRKKIFKEK
jgi:PEP-CTERM motif-containing protein